MSHQEKDYILGLMTEVIDIIAREYLDPKDIYALRSTCTTLHQKTLHAFNQTFETVSTDLTAESVQRLEQISKNAALKKQVKTLFFRRGESGRGFGERLQWPRLFHGPVRPGQVLSLPGHLEQQYPAIIPKLIKLLQYDFTNCRSFRILHQSERHRHHRHIGRDDILGPLYIITLLFHILAETEIQPKLFDLDVHLDLNKQLITLPYHGLLFPASWQKLENLNFNKILLEDNRNIMVWIADIILNIPNLKKLVLQFGIVSK